MENEKYSFELISRVVDEIDQISLSRQYEFINAEVIENKIDKDKIDIIIKIFLKPKKCTICFRIFISMVL